jgi:hypothetical protein
MSHFAFIGNVVRNIQTLQDQAPGSLLFLFKPMEDSYRTERFEVLMLEMKTGKRKEYFEYFLSNPEFIHFYIYPKWDEFSITQIKREFGQLPTDTAGRKYSA